MPSHQFTRKLTPDRLQVESTCKLCGFAIVKGVAEGLETAEWEHLASCPKAQAAAESG